MKVTPYQHNANLLKEYHKVIHQQNLKELERLNRQAEERFKAHWVKTGSVDVYV